MSDVFFSSLQNFYTHSSLSQLFSLLLHLHFPKRNGFFSTLEEGGIWGMNPEKPGV